VSLEEARAALAQMERIGADGWCLCVSSSAQSEVESALRKLIADHENALTTIAADVEYIARIDAEITRLRALIEPPTDDDPEAAWRKAIADQVRRNCTPSGDAYQKGGDYLVYAVADWIENPPEWSAFTPPSAGFRRQGPACDDGREALTDENLWDFADSLLDAWNIEDTNAPSLSEDFRDRFSARFRRQGPITEADRRAHDKYDTEIPEG